MESLAEVRGLQEDNMDLMRKAAGGAMQTIKMKDGKLKMDSFTASAIMQVFDKVNSANQKKMAVMINKGTKDGMLKLQSFAMKQVKSGYGEEVEIDEEWKVGDKAFYMGKRVKITKVWPKGGYQIDGKTNVSGNELSFKEEVELNERPYRVTNPDLGVWTGEARSDGDAAEKAMRKWGVRKGAAASKSFMKKTTIKKEFDFLEADLDEAGLYAARQLKDPKKEMMVAKDKKVEVIDKKDWPKYKKKGYIQAEGVIYQTYLQLFNETDAQVKSYIDDIVHQMNSSAHKNLAKFADAFKKHAYKTMDPRKSLDAVLPSSVKDKQKANLLNMEFDLDEGKMSELHQHIKDGKSAKEIAKIMKVDEKTIQKLMAGYNEAWEIGTDEYRAYLEKLTPGETNEVEEASARADAKRHMRKDREVDPADVDTDASDEDIKAASKHIIMQMRKVISLKGNFKVEFGDKKKVKIPVKIAQAVIQKYNSIKKPAEKEKFQTKVAKSHRDMLMVLKAGYNESTDTILGRIDKKLKEFREGDNNGK